MHKFFLLLGVIIALSGCTNIKISAAMCNQIAADPNHPPMPQECRDYNEKEADKAFNKVVDEKKVSDKDLEFSRDK